MSKDQEIVQVLEEISEKYCDNALTNYELSAWIEKNTSEELRKTINSQLINRKSGNQTAERRFKRIFQSTMKRTRIPLRFCYSEYNNQDPLNKKPMKKSDNAMKTHKFALVKSNERAMNSTDYQNVFRITTIPLPKQDFHFRNKSMNSKKNSKLEDYYDRSFLIVKKSPPTVSGFSVTFYSKNT